MNKIYRLRFDRRRNELVVVSEITTGTGKEKNTGHVTGLSGPSPFVRLMGTLTPLAFLTGLVISLLPGMAQSADLPTGGQIVAGQGSISTSGNQMTIHQQTQNMVTNWYSFDIGRNNTVQFIQPDSSSVALNRVTGASGSQIMGALKANGQVFILNPGGVLFGKDARVNVAGLVASTKNINTADFMKGQYTLSGSGNPGTQVINQGSLTTSKGGYIVLAGERVSNSGTVTTPSGKTVLAAGKAVTLQLDESGLTSVSVNGSVVNALVENRGLISATNGQVYLTAKGQDMLLNTVVNNSGTIEAKGLASRGGEIVLDGSDSGVVSQSGQLLADSHTGRGGKITLEGQNIHLAGSSLTSATGRAGGGEVYVGGGWQGQDRRIRNASRVVMDKAAMVDVSATEAGNGGTAVLWSDNYTNFQGTILAKGGGRSGHGGQVETSSHQNLQVTGAVDASARAGRGGDWLLDPTDVTIVGTGTDTGIDSVTADNTDVFTPTASGAQILNTSIENPLNNGTDVRVQTSGTNINGQSGNITVNADISKTAGADASLTLAADGNITLSNHSITSSAGKLDIHLLGAGSNTARILVTDSRLVSNGGNITLDQLNHSTTGSDGSVVVNPNAMTVKVVNSTLNASSSEANATKGDITVSAYNPNVNLSLPAYNNTTRNGGTLLEVSGNSTLTGGNITLYGEQSGNLTHHLPVFINGATLLADHDITLRGVGTNGSAAVNLEIRGSNTANNTLTSAGGNITLENQVSGNGTGVLLSGNGTGHIVLTAQNGTLTLNGSSVNGTGVNITNATLNAAHANITGCSTGGTGFSLTHTTLQGSLADLANVTLSSAGSGAGATNLLDSSVVTAGNLNNLLKNHIENMTTVEMDGKTVHDDSQETAADKKGWTADYTSDSAPNGGWIFNHTTVNAGGDVALKGVGFTNTTVNVTQGNLSIDNGGTVNLTKSVVRVSNGSITLTSDSGAVDLTNATVNSVAGGVNITAVGMTAEKGSISAEKDITIVTGGSATLSNGTLSSNGALSVNATGGPVYLTNTSISTTGDINILSDGDRVAAWGTRAITSKEGNITLRSNNGTGVNGILLNGKVNITAVKGDITLETHDSGTTSSILLTGGTKANTGTTLNAGGNLTLRSVSDKGATAGQTEFMGIGNVLTATNGTLTIENTAAGSNTSALWVHPSAAGGLQLTAKDIVLHGVTTGNHTALALANTVLNATNAINITGQSASGSGTTISGSTLNGATAAITGISTSGGLGFSITGSTLQGNLADLNNVTLSSAGSGAGAINKLDSSVVTDSNRDNLLKNHIENMTTVDMNGTAIFDDAQKTDKGWTHDYTSESTPNGGWIFNNTTVNAGGDVALKGVGFTNATVNVTKGNLSIDNNGPVLLTGSNVAVENGSVNLHAATGTIDLSKGNINTKGDITLQASNGTISISGASATDKANLTSTAGNISLTTSAIGSGVSMNMNNITIEAEGDVQLSGSRIALNNSNISGQNITADLDNSVSGGVAWSQSSSILNATKNITLSNNATGTLAQGATFTNSTLTAGEDVSLNFSRVYSNKWNDNSSGFSFSGGRISAGNDVVLTGYFANGHNGKGLSVGGNSVITATGGNITLNGTAGATGPEGASQVPDGAAIDGATLSAVNGTVTLGGSASDGAATGLTLNNLTLNAAYANITGSNRGGGTGFSLSNLTWQGGLTDINNITLSSAGSSRTATNRLGVGVVDSSKLIALMKKGIENTTYVDKSLNDAVKSNLSADGNGDINATFGSGDRLGAWTFDGIDLNATRNINLSGIGFTNSTLQAGGGLTINDESSVDLSGSHITAGQNISLIGNGGITLTKSNMTAGKDITLQASNGTISISGASATDRANLTSTAGNITVNGAVKGYYTGVKITNADISAAKGVITVSGASDGNSNGAGAVLLGGQSSFNSTLTSITGTDTYSTFTGTSSGVAIDAGSNIAFYGNTTITGTSSNAVGVLFLSTYGARPTKLTFSDGFVTLQGISNARSKPANYVSSVGGISIRRWSSLPNTVYLHVSNATLNMSGSATVAVDGISAGGTIFNGPGNTANDKGYVFTGNGSVNIKGVAVSGTGLEARILNNTGLNGTFTVTGESTSGVGVNVSTNVNATLVNATITGKSDSGVGVSITTVDAYSKVADLNNNTIIGTSNTSSGILINGNNVTITNGTLCGTSAGSGAGVSLTGGSNYTIDGATVTGQSVDGTGVSASGNLAVNNNASITGAATGDGTGVSVNGTLASDGGVSISGTASSGDGVQVAGDTALNNATVSGNSTDGSGIHVAGNLTNHNTTLSGNASGQGSGVEVGGNITGGTITGNADSGNGVLVNGGDTTVTNATITG
ncbi:filamentous hemagglutinin N-terminal domain-containing protein, partial [Salmonella enterica]|nr:filamentous hemagglutinin N-terminal domain-containing protein [Salmonella enterica]ELG7063961.1 filamentous hemagglutinin N-terminal domain-containing protein [Salmonella enterica]ELG7108909.1 filamentous hemagglutinin N-terminal domain-containing protein [Salmonella enterica]ELG7154163.1 filamentous hemagglutinin N-terminal domain-containing protein [Salmonella enterica]ELH8506358.1 filamentous hemagglutinin N-terminal domain-containing protein [Salmonella enterica]